MLYDNPGHVMKLDLELPAQNVWDPCAVYRTEIEASGTEWQLWAAYRN